MGLTRTATSTVARSAVVLTLLTFLALLVGACADAETATDEAAEDGSTNGDGDAAVEEDDGDVEATADEVSADGDDEAEGPGDDADGPLVLYTNDFEDIIGERFTADTGIDIEVVKESGGVLLSRIAAERANPQWDVLLFDGPGSLFRMDEEGQLRRDVEPSNLDNLTDFARELLPANRSWFPVGATASCAIAYRTDLVESPPAEFEDLTDPRYEGRIGQADPAVAAPAYPCVSEVFWQLGWEEATDFYGGILDNDLRVFRTNGPTGRALASGEIEIAMLSSPNIYSLIADGEPVEVVWPEEGVPSSSRGVAVQADTERPSAATAFVEWMLEPETQQFLTDEAGKDGWFLASVDGVTPKPDGPPDDAVYRIAPPAFAADEEATIKEWFADQAVN